MSEKAYVAFGSNIGDKKKNIEDAVNSLSAVPGINVLAVSSMYTTKPWGFEEQDDFVNACALLEVSISPEVLLGVCLGIEAGMGRVRKFTNGPRIIDIDVLMYADAVRNTEELILPHPRMFERDFVLVPLSEIVQGELKKKIETALAEITDKYVVQ